LPFSSVKWAGLEPAGPAWMSATMAVPAFVPSLTQSSIPFAPSLAANQTFPSAT
jgi:hypothetical protein